MHVRSLAHEIGDQDSIIISSLVPHVLSIVVTLKIFEKLVNITAKFAVARRFERYTEIQDAILCENDQMSFFNTL